MAGRFAGWRFSVSLVTVLYVLGGSGLGFAWQRFIGCRTGTCPITSNPYISTAYGGLLGFLVSGSTF